MGNHVFLRHTSQKNVHAPPLISFAADKAIVLMLEKPSGKALIAYTSLVIIVGLSTSKIKPLQASSSYEKLLMLRLVLGYCSWDQCIWFGCEYNMLRPYTSCTAPTERSDIFAGRVRKP